MNIQRDAIGTRHVFCPENFAMRADMTKKRRMKGTPMNEEESKLNVKPPGGCT